MLHDLLHVCAPAPLGCDEDTRRRDQTVARDTDGLNAVAKSFLHELGQFLESSLLLFLATLLFFGLFKIKSVLCDAPELLTI